MFISYFEAVGIALLRGEILKIPQLFCPDHLLAEWFGYDILPIAAEYDILPIAAEYDILPIVAEHSEILVITILKKLITVE